MIGVFASGERSQEAAAQLAIDLCLPLAERSDLECSSQYELLLELGEAGLSLHQTGPKRPGPIRVDFISGAVAHRRQYGGGSGQMIAKACGVTSKIKPRIADLTAGLGRDSFVLASLGAQVQMVERVPVVYRLLRDGLDRGLIHGDEQEREILARMPLSFGEGVDWCAANVDAADVIYLDPMFPHSNKSAQVKKEMFAFRSLVGADLDTEALLAAALDAARCRVVVKRPRKAPTIKGRNPSYALEGKSGRFDIYALKKIE